MSEDTLTPTEPTAEPHHSEAPADAANVAQGDFGGSDPETTTAPAQEDPLSGTGLPDAYVKALEKANTHLIFGEIKNHVANFGYTMLSGFKALEHILQRDQEPHADASAAWERVKAALKQAGAQFEEEEAAISNWLRISDPRPPIVVHPQAQAQEATASQAPPVTHEAPPAEATAEPQAPSEPVTTE